MNFSGLTVLHSYVTMQILIPVMAVWKKTHTKNALSLDFLAIAILPSVIRFNGLMYHVIGKENFSRIYASEQQVKIILL